MSREIPNEVVIERLFRLGYLRKTINGRVTINKGYFNKEMSRRDKVGKVSSMCLSNFKAKINYLLENL